MEPSNKSGWKRRRWLQGGVALGALAGGVPLAVWGQDAPRKRPKSPPVWAGFGLNGGVGQARFDLTREHIRRVKGGMDLTHPEAFSGLRDALLAQLRKQDGSTVQFKRSVEFGEDLLLGFAHDYEVSVGARVEKDGENANTLFIFMSGVGLILGFAPSTGWRVVSSFPFMLRFERPGGDLKNIRSKAVAYMGEAYNGYAQAFAHFVSRFDKWDQGFSSNYFARLSRAAIHKDAQAKFTDLKIDKMFSTELLGFSASSVLCDQLNIPLLPYQDNDALNKRYAVKFTDDLRAQDVIDIPDADLRFEVIVRDLDKKLIPSSQKGLTILRRQLVLNFRVLDAYADNKDKPIFQTIAVSAPDDDKMPLGSTEDDTPERDMVFFERLLTRTLSHLLRGIATKNAELLSQVGVRLDTVAPAIPRLLELCAKTR